MPLSPPHDQVPALRRTQSMIRRKEAPKLTSEELAIEQREQLSRRAVHDRSTRVDLLWSPLEAGDVPGESKGDVLPSRDVRASLESSGPTTEEDREDLSRRTRLDRFSPGFSAHTQSSPRHFHFPPPSDASRYLDPSKAYCERLGTIPNNPAQQVNGLCSSSLVAPSRLNASMHTPQGLREMAATLDGLPPPGIRNYHLPFRPEIVAPSPTRAQSLMPPSVWNGFSLARSDTSPMGSPSEFTDIPMDEIPCKANAAHPPYDTPQPISSRPSVGSFVSESTTLASKSSGLWNISRQHPAYPPTFPTKSSEEFGGGESLRDREARSVLDHFGRACKDVKSRSSGPEGMHSISADRLMRLRNARAQKVKLERKKRRGCCNCGQAFWEAIGRCLRTCSNALMRTASWFCCRRERVDSVV